MTIGTPKKKMNGIVDSIQSTHANNNVHECAILHCHTFIQPYKLIVQRNGDGVKELKNSTNFYMTHVHCT